MEPAENNQITQMIHDLEDGIIGEDERRQLMDLMRENPEVRKAYRQHMKLVTVIRTEAQLAYSGGNNPVLYQQRRSTIYSITAAAAILTLLAVVGYIIQISTDPRPEKSIILTGDHDSIWSTVTPDGDGNSSVKPGTQITIERGIVSLDFSSAVKAVLEGPAKVHVLSHNEIRLETGRGWFQVAPEGHGFTVHTNHLKIIDLGTEFGVITAEDGREEVHVARGKVRVSSRRDKSRNVELTAGQAISTWITEQLHDTPCRPDAFLKNLPGGTPYIHWSFDSHENGIMTAKGTLQDLDKYAMRLHSFLSEKDPTVKEVQGRHGKALHLPGNGVYAASDFPGIGENLPRTIALWVQLAAQNEDVSPKTAAESAYVPGLVGWGNPNMRHRHWRVGINDNFPIKNIVTLWGYEYSRSPLKDTSSVTDGNWHHLAFVFTGGYDNSGQPVIRHYLDGKRLPEIVHSTVHTRIDTDITSAHAQTLRLGPDARDNPGENTFSGLIDELFIFRGALNDAQIKNLMETNSYQQAPPQQTTHTENNTSLNQ